MALNPFDTIPSIHWAFLCLSHKKNFLELELVNLKTERAHRLTFSAAGTDTVGGGEDWLQGTYYQRFATKYAAKFEDFNGKLAMLTPRAHKTSTKHVFRIGFLATINIPEDPHYTNWHLYGFCQVKYGSGEMSKGLTFFPYFENKSERPLF
jgi:hypothetical protein